MGFSLFRSTNESPYSIDIDMFNIHNGWGAILSMGFYGNNVEVSDSYELTQWHEYSSDTYSGWVFNIGLKKRLWKYLHADLTVGLGVRNEYKIYVDTPPVVLDPVTLKDGSKVRPNARIGLGLDLYRVLIKGGYDTYFQSPYIGASWIFKLD